MIRDTIMIELDDHSITRECEIMHDSAYSWLVTQYNGLAISWMVWQSTKYVVDLSHFFSDWDTWGWCPLTYQFTNTKVSYSAIQIIISVMATNIFCWSLHRLTQYSWSWCYQIKHPIKNDKNHSNRYDVPLARILGKFMVIRVPSTISSTNG